MILDSKSKFGCANARASGAMRRLTKIATPE